MQTPPTADRRPPTAVAADSPAIAQSYAALGRFALLDAVARPAGWTLVEEYALPGRTLEPARPSGV